jgi:hypothetical protein
MVSPLLANEDGAGSESRSGRELLTRQRDESSTIDGVSFHPPHDRVCPKSAVQTRRRTDDDARGLTW